MTTEDQQVNQVELKRASKHYGDFVAIDKVDLAVEKGAFFSILGPSGGGKTTILRAIAGLLDLTDGELTIAGAPMQGVPVYKRNVGVVFQNYALFPHMNVTQNVAFGLRMRGLSSAEVATKTREVLERVRLGAFAERMPGQLSGGQQQRVALARALVVNPQVLLLDEPLGALDRNLRLDMQAELRSLQRTFNLTTICVTHDQEEALTLSDRIAVMSQGRIEQVGTPVEIYEKPASRFVASFVGGTNLLDAHVLGTEGEDLILDWRGYRLRIDTPKRFVKDSPVSVSLRYEEATVAPGAPQPGAENALPGTVENIAYRGGGYIAHIRVADDTVMVAMGAGTKDLTLAQPVTISWGKDAPRILVA